LYGAVWFLPVLNPTVTPCLGKWDGKRLKNKSFWQNFRKSQKGVVRQATRGMFLFWIHPPSLPNIFLITQVRELCPILTVSIFWGISFSIFHVFIERDCTEMKGRLVSGKCIGESWDWYPIPHGMCWGAEVNMNIN
jgi:hypothetical protein